MRLRDIFTFEKGRPPPGLDVISSEDRLPLIQVETLRDRTVLHSRVPADRDVICREDDILLVWDGANCGFSATGFAGIVGSTIMRLRCSVPAISTTYVAYFLRSRFKDLRRSAYGAEVQHLSRDYVFDMQIPIPPPQDQERTVALFARLDRIAEDRKSSILLTDKLIHSLYSSMFVAQDAEKRGWAKTTLSTVMREAPQNGVYKSQSAYGSGTKILRIDSFNDGRLINRPLKRLEISKDAESYYRLSEGDLVINRVNSLEYLGKSLLIPDFQDPVVFESNLMRIRLKNDVAVPAFIAIQLQSSEVKRQIFARAKKAGNQASINQQDVNGLLIELPPTGLQLEFTYRVNRIERVYQQQLMQQETIGQFISAMENHLFDENGQLTKLPNPSKYVDFVDDDIAFVNEKFEDLSRPATADASMIEASTKEYSATSAKYSRANLQKNLILSYQGPFSFSDLANKATAMFDVEPSYEEMKDAVFALLTRKPQGKGLTQYFDEGRGEMLFQVRQ